VSINYAFCLLDIIDWLHQAKSTVLIVPIIHEREFVFPLHGELSMTSSELVLAVVPLALWAQVLSRGLLRRNKSVFIYDLIKIRIVGRVNPGTRIKPLVLL